MVSIEYLLEAGQKLDKSVIKENIDLSRYKGSSRAKKDSCVREKFPDAVIHPLLAKTKLTKGQRIFDNLLGIFTDAPFGTADVYQGLKDADRQYYLAEQGDKQFLVFVTDAYMVSHELAQKQYADTFETEDIKFTKCSYEVTHQRDIDKGKTGKNDPANHF